MSEKLNMTVEVSTQTHPLGRWHKLVHKDFPLSLMRVEGEEFVSMSEVGVVWTGELPKESCRIQVSLNNESNHECLCMAKQSFHKKLRTAEVKLIP